MITIEELRKAVPWVTILTRETREIIYISHNESLNMIITIDELGSLPVAGSLSGAIKHWSLKKPAPKERRAYAYRQAGGLLAFFADESENKLDQSMYWTRAPEFDLIAKEQQ